jgi:hypothetical protein
MVFAGRIHGGRSRVEAVSAYTNVLGVFLHLLDVFVVFPPIYKSRDGSNMLMLVSHAARHVWRR